MKSFIITVEKFLKMDTEVEEYNFCDKKESWSFPFTSASLNGAMRKLLG